MTKVLNRISKAGSQEHNEPRLLGSATQDALRSNETQADARHERCAQSQKKLYPDTHLCVDLKLWTLRPGRMAEDTQMDGMLTRDSGDHFTFHERGILRRLVPTREKRNPHVFEGTYITITRRDDGTLRLNFRSLKQDTFLDINGFALEVANEIRRGLKGLGEER